MLLIQFSFVTLHCHSIPLGKIYSTLIHSFGRGLILYKYIYIYIYIYISFKNIFYHPSLLYQSMLWEGVDVTCQTFLLSPCIALSFHATRKNYPTLIHSFGMGLFGFWKNIYRYIYIDFFQQSLLLSFMSLPFQISEECHSTTHSLLNGWISL